MLTENPGLHSEQIDIIKTYATTWRLMGFADVKEFLSSTENYKAYLEKLYEICTKANCPQMEKLHEISEHLESVETDQKSVIELLGHSSEEKRSKRDKALLPIVGKLTKLLFGTADEDELNEIQYHIRSNENNTHILAELLANQTKIVQVQFEKDRELLKASEKQINAYAKKFNLTAHEEAFNSAISKLDRKVDEHGKDQDKLINAIIFAKEGQIHPKLLPLDVIKDSVETIKGQMRHLEFPISLSELSASALTKISEIKIYYLDGKLVYTVEIPLLNLETFKLYRHTPLPVVQKGNRVAYILPKQEYTAISDDLVYFRLSAEEKSTCKKGSNKLICKDDFPVFKIDDNSECEIKLITKPSFKNFSSCNIVIRNLRNSYWKKLESRNTWLFTVIESENLNINCVYYQKTIEIYGTGAITLSAGCSAKSQTVSLKANRLLTSRRNFTFYEKKKLNLEGILDSVDGDFNLKNTIKETLDSELARKIDDHTDLDKSGIELTKIIAKANEIAKFNEIKNKISIIENGAMFTGAGLLGVLFAGLLSWKIGLCAGIAATWATCKGCCTKHRQRITQRRETEANEPPRYEIRYIVDGRQRTPNHQGLSVAAPLIEAAIISNQPRNIQDGNQTQRPRRNLTSYDRM